MIPAKSKANIWIQIVCATNERRDEAFQILQLLKVAFDADIAKELLTTTTMDGEKMKYEFWYTILSGRLFTIKNDADRPFHRRQTVAVFVCWRRTDDDDDGIVDDVKHSYADGYISLPPVSTNAVIYRPSRSFRLQSLEDEIVKRWPTFIANRSRGNALKQLSSPERFETYYDVDQDEWYEAVAGRNARYFLADDEEMLLNSPCYLLYAIIADIKRNAASAA